MTLTKLNPEVIAPSEKDKIEEEKYINRSIGKLSSGNKLYHGI